MHSPGRFGAHEAQPLPTLKSHPHGYHKLVRDNSLLLRPLLNKSVSSVCLHGRKPPEKHCRIHPLSIATTALLQQGSYPPRRVQRLREAMRTARNRFDLRITHDQHSQVLLAPQLPLIGQLLLLLFHQRRDHHHPVHNNRSLLCLPSQPQKRISDRPTKSPHSHRCAPPCPNNNRPHNQPVVNLHSKKTMFNPATRRPHLILSLSASQYTVCIRCSNRFTMWAQAAAER